MTNDELRWAARNINGVSVSYSGQCEWAGDKVYGVRDALYELAQLREEKARNWSPAPSLWQRWFGGER